MTSFARISAAQAAVLIADKNVQIIDIRDRQSYELAHIENAQHIDNNSMQSFLEHSDMDLPLIVYCYHGNSSQPAAAYLSEQGFSRVYSIDGGFEHWAQEHSEKKKS
jgi:thiosulfate sulfurtransferase